MHKGCLFEYTLGRKRLQLLYLENGCLVDARFALYAAAEGYEDDFILVVEKQVEAEEPYAITLLHNNSAESITVPIPDDHVREELALMAEHTRSHAVYIPVARYHHLVQKNPGMN